MAAGKASTCRASQPVTGVSPLDVVAWAKAEALAATRRAVDAVLMVPVDGGSDALREVLQNVRLLLEAHGPDHAAEAPGPDHAAEAVRLITGVVWRCPERARKSVKAVALQVRDVLVLRCLSEMEPKYHGNRDVFLVVVARAFGQTDSREYEDIILHSYRKLTWGRSGTFQSKTEKKQRQRTRRSRPDASDVEHGLQMRPDASDVELGLQMSMAVASFLAGEDFSDGASASDEAESVRPPASAQDM